MSTSTEKNYGFYHPKSANEYGTVVWLGIDGEEHHVTIVMNTSENPYSHDYTNPSEVVHIGELIRWVRDGHKVYL